MSLRLDQEAQLLHAVQRLEDKHLLHEGDALSLRLPGRGLLLWRAGSLTEFASNATADAAALHAAIYRQRPDVGAVALLSPRWSVLQGQTAQPLPVCFDEQARHLGRPWQPRDPLARQLASGGNAGVVDGRLLALGVTLNRAVFNAELFEKCAMACVLAQAGGRVHRLPWWVRLIAGRRLAKDQARAAASHRAGRAAAELVAY